ncbi:MAG: hypothetical protein ABFC38_14185 [Methanospirillum sp.]
MVNWERIITYIPRLSILATLALAAILIIFFGVPMLKADPPSGYSIITLGITIFALNIAQLASISTEKDMRDIKDGITRIGERIGDDDEKLISQLEIVIGNLKSLNNSNQTSNDLFLNVVTEIKHCTSLLDEMIKEITDTNTQIERKLDGILQERKSEEKIVNIKMEITCPDGREKHTTNIENTDTSPGSE